MDRRPAWRGAHVKTTAVWDDDETRSGGAAPSGIRERASERPKRTQLGSVFVVFDLTGDNNNNNKKSDTRKRHIIFVWGATSHFPRRFASFIQTRPPDVDDDDDVTRVVAFMVQTTRGETRPARRRRACRHARDGRGSSSRMMTMDEARCGRHDAGNRHGQRRRQPLRGKQHEEGTHNDNTLAGIGRRAIEPGQSKNRR